MTRLIVIICLLHFSHWLLAQNAIGLPEMINYSRHTYKGGAQTRQIAQDKNGIIYFANDEGLLTFNGARWKIFPLPNKSLVRCLEYSPDDKLYVGGQDELGYFSRDGKGNLAYHSLKQLLPKAVQSFADVWEIAITQQGIFFQTSKHIYHFYQDQVKVYEDPHWLFLGQAGQRVLAQSENRGLLTFHNGGWEPFKIALPTESIVTAVTGMGNNQWLMTTLKHGIFTLQGQTVSKLQSPLLAKLERTNISAAQMVNKHHIAIGTHLDGCYIIDREGNLVRSFGKAEGLQNINILGIFLDKQQNLWLGLHNGIDFIAYNNAVKHIHPNHINDGAGLSSHIYNGKLYISTSTGVFSIPVLNKHLGNIRDEFLPIKHTQGDAWNLGEVDNKLLVGHNDGAMVIAGNQATKLDKQTGYWNFQPLDSTTMVAGTYNGISIFEQSNNGFTQRTSVSTESARFVEVHNNKIWFSHPYKGVYAINRQGNQFQVKKYSSKEGVHSANDNYLFKIKGALLLTTAQGIYEYDSNKDIFKPAVFYNKHLPKIPVRYLKEDKAGNVWFVFEKKVGVLDLSGKPQLIYLPELDNKIVAGFEHINPIDAQNILIGGEKGFYHINYEQYKQLRYPLTVHIAEVSAISAQDSLLYAGFVPTASQKKAVFNHSINSLHFEFSSPMYGHLASVEYSYLLQGFDDKWVDFNKRTEKDYTNLPQGDYVFKVKARNNLGNESPVSEYAFTVLPPWYRTTIAYIIYVLMAGGLAYLLFRYQKRKFKEQQRRHEEEQQHLQYMHQLEMDKAEKELIQLRNQKLEAELLDKTTELASASMHLVQKSDVLLKVKEQMKKLKDTPAPDLKKILKTLNEEDRMEEQWQQFSIHFDAVHHNFLATLRKKHPNLTANDHKLCAYLKMNLSTKEIAQLMNISVRGVEISRYRLRKKLEVPEKMNLFTFLDSLQEAEQV